MSFSEMEKSTGWAGIRDEKSGRKISHSWNSQEMLGGGRKQVNEDSKSSLNFLSYNKVYSVKRSCLRFLLPKFCVLYIIIY